MDDDSDGEPDDWPAAHHARELDDALRCGVCKSLLRTPMRAGCPHVFCSECIRGWLATGKACCPTCREAMDPAQLRPDATLHTIVSAFRAARPQLLAAVNAVNAVANRAEASPHARTHARARPPPAAGAAAVAIDHAVIEVSDGDDSDSVFVTEAPARRKPSLGGARSIAPSRVDSAPSATHAACPVCSCQVPLKLLDAHVNGCLDKGPAHAGHNGGARAPAAAAPVQLPPVLTLNLLSLTALKTYLRQWKLLDGSSSEKRDVLEARWMAFMKNVKVEKDRALTTGLPVNVAAAAAKTLREERTRSSAALISPIMRKHAASVAAAPAAKADGFAALVGQVRARKAPPAAASVAPEAADDLESSPAADGRPKRKRSQG